MSQITDVKNAVDIVEVIGERVQLTHAGNQWRGLCPFHSEKSPSFFVSQEFQRYKCFGCGESGDVLSFLQKYEGMTFAEALQTLADRAGIVLTSYRPTAEDDQRRRLLEILSLTKEYYHYVLTKHEAGQPARDYLKNRGITQESIRLFQMGYSLSAWDGLLVYLRDKKKYQLDDLVATGMFVQRERGNMYDRFRGRLMFPLTNHRGQVVGFSGRVLDPAAKDAKYINTPETSLYHKSEMLFGYSELLPEIRKKKEIIVVEGEFDVIASTQAHINNVVAIKGSALTKEHLQLMSRVAEKVMFSLDMDSAGVAATKRAITLNEQMQLEARVIVLPAGKDPGELALKQPAVWREAVKASISIYEYLLQAALKQHDATSPEGKRAIIDDLAPVFSQITHAVEKDVYVKKIAAALQVKENLVREDVERFKLGKNPPARTKKPAAKAEAHDNENLSLDQQRRLKLEKYVLHLVLSAPDAQFPEVLGAVSELPWQTAGASALLARLSQASSRQQLGSIIKELPEDLSALYFEWQADPRFGESLPSDVWQTEWQKTLPDLKQTMAKIEISQISAKIAQLESLPELSEAQDQEREALLSQIEQLQRKLRIQN